MQVYPLALVYSLFSQKRVHRDGRQFLDEEAELSEKEGSVSSDECDGEELNKSLEGFVVDTTQFSQGLNGKEKASYYGLICSHLNFLIKAF